MLKVTTSWDDGDVLDLRLSKLLSNYGLTGTFYITKNYRSQRLADQDIIELARTHEIGAHTLTHPDLRTLIPEQQSEEITGSKKWLEQLLNSEIPMFCYPKGLYDTSAVEAVKKSGFCGARTTELACIKNAADPFQLPTTLQVYPFPFRKANQNHYYWRKLVEPYSQRAKALQELGVSWLNMYSWLSVAKATFDIARQQGEVFHLWGHSWEIEKYGMWNELERFFQYIKQQKNCTHITNSQLLNP